MKQLGFCVIASGLSAPAGADSVFTSQGQPNLVGVPFTGIPGNRVQLALEPSAVRRRGMHIEVHGLMYGLNDGLLKNLDCSVDAAAG